MTIELTEEQKLKVVAFGFDKPQSWEERAIKIHARACECGGYTSGIAARAKRELGVTS